MLASNHFDGSAKLGTNQIGTAHRRPLPHPERARHVMGCPARALQDSFVCVAIRAEGRNQFGNVVGAAGFHGDVDGRVSQIYVVVGAIVGSLDDVGAVLGTNSGQPVQSSGVIGKMYTQAN